MSLEQKIDELITAINANTAALGGVSNIMSTPVMEPVGTPAQQMAQNTTQPAPFPSAAPPGAFATAPAPASTPATPAPAQPAPSPAPAGAAQPAAASAGGEVSRDTLYQTMTAVVQRMGDQGAGLSGLLQQYGVAKIGDLTPDQYAPAIAAAKQMAGML